MTELPDNAIDLGVVSEDDVVRSPWFSEANWQGGGGEYRLVAIPVDHTMPTVEDVMVALGFAFEGSTDEWETDESYLSHDWVADRLAPLGIKPDPMSDYPSRPKGGTMNNTKPIIEGSARARAVMTTRDEMVKAIADFVDWYGERLAYEFMVDGGMGLPGGARLMVVEDGMGGFRQWQPEGAKTDER